MHRQFIEAVCAIAPPIAQASNVAREFLALIHRRDVDGLDRRLARARNGKPMEIRRFAASLTADPLVVRATFASPWPSGQVHRNLNAIHSKLCGVDWSSSPERTADIKAGAP